MSETRLVRLHPRDLSKGYPMATYGMNLGKTTAKFVAGTWYTVPREMADHLATVRERVYDDSSRLAFEVCGNEKDAMAFVKREREEASRGVRPEDAVTMAMDFSTMDLPKAVRKLNAADPSEDELRGEAPVESEAPKKSKGKSKGKPKGSKRGPK